MAIQKQYVKALHLSDNVVTDVNYLVTLTSGGIISSDMSIHQHNMNILSGNFIQTASKLGVGIKNFSSKNAFIQAEEAFDGEGKTYGIACAGCVGYVILSVDAMNNRLKLDGDLTAMTSNASALSSAWSFALDKTSGSSCLYIDHVDEPYVYMKSLPDSLQSMSALTEEDCRLIAEKDDNGIYCPEHPDCGISSLNTFYAQHVEGGSTKAFGKYAHAEGRASIADCRYAHAEGSETFAGGIGSHAEGFYGKAMEKGAHAEGIRTYALGGGSHAEGNATYAIAAGAHAEGIRTYAYGKFSHAEGVDTSAIAPYSHASGERSIAMGNFSFCGGSSCSAVALRSFAIGNMTYANGANSIAEGLCTYATGEMSHACGNACSALGINSFAGGQQTIANGHCSYGYGVFCETTTGRAIALGTNAKADKYESYVWSAENNNFYDADGKYHAQKQGAYCINPIDDISGFYIGTSSLDQVILAESRKLLKTYITSSLAMFMSKAQTGTVQNEDVINALSTLYTMANA